MNIKSSFLFLIPVIIIIGSCATDNKLKNDVLGLEKKHYENVSRIKEIEDSIGSIRKNLAELGAKIDGVQSDLQVLTGRFEEGRYHAEMSLRDVTSVQENYSIQIKALESRLDKLQEQLKTIETAVVSLQPQSPQEAKPPAETKEAEKSKGDLYREAYNTFRHGDMATSREMFKKFLKAHPKGEYSDNAQFWIAETYYSEKDYENAILSYEDLIKKFPKSDKLPNAMLKQGYAFYELGDKPSGKLLMKRVIEKFPKSEEAGLARKKLKEEAPKSSKKKK